MAAEKAVQTTIEENIWWWDKKVQQKHNTVSLYTSTDPSSRIIVQICWNDKGQVTNPQPVHLLAQQQIKNMLKQSIYW